MKTVHATSYARKPRVKRVSREPRALPLVGAGEGIEFRNFRAEKITSPIVSYATENVGLTIYELLGMAELMRVAYEKGELESVQNRLSLLVTEAAGLATSVQDILDLKKIEADPDGPVMERFDIIALLSEVTETARRLVGDKAITVMDASSPGPVVIYSDRSKIKQIMTGLLSNAVKYTDRGRVAVIASKDDNELKLTVADTGRGMTQEQVNALLEPSDYGYDFEMKGLASSGLGLGIIRALIKKLDARLSIASKEGEGTIVTISLPQRQPA